MTLFRLLLVAYLWLACFKVSSAQTGNGALYGLKRVGSEFYLATLNLTSGTGDVISTTPLVSTVSNAWGTVNTARNSYFFSSSGQLLEIDLTTGSIQNTYPDGALHYLKYNCNDSTLYGLKIIGNEWYLARINQATGIVETLSNSAVASIVNNAWGTIHPIRNSYFFSSGGNVLEIDLVSGTMVHAYPEGDLNFLDYNCSDSTLYGLKKVDGLWYFAKFDFEAGNAQTLSTSPVASIVANLWGTVNQSTKSYFFATMGQIVEVDISSGNVVNTYAEGDLNFLDYNYCCSVSKEIPITDSLVVPNAFSPNKDEKNDFFQLQTNLDPSQFEISILNRWGLEVYRSSSIAFMWDGKNKGSDCTDGTYYYILQYKDKSGDLNTKTGFLQLMR